MPSTTVQINPLRYRGYVYDHELGLYYLQSRYYNPTLGRFLNADALVSTGQGVLGNNMFAYCRNNPIVLEDATGTADRACIYAEGRMDEEPWRDHSPGGGGIPRRNYSSSSNYYGEVADKFYTVRFLRAVSNGLEYLWNAYVHSNELQVQQKYEQDMAVRDHWNDVFSSPGRLRDFIGMTSAIITACSAYVKLAMASSVAFGPIAGLIVALVPAVISILEYYGVIDISELEWEAFEL